MKFIRFDVFFLFLLILSFAQGVVLTHNASARVIRSNQSLVLQRVTRHSAGNYSCSAINAEGETVSNQLELRVKCKYNSSIFFTRRFLYSQCIHSLTVHNVQLSARYNRIRQKFR